MHPVTSFTIVLSLTRPGPESGIKEGVFTSITSRQFPPPFVVTLVFFYHGAPAPFLSRTFFPSWGMFPWPWRQDVPSLPGHYRGAAVSFSGCRPWRHMAPSASLTRGANCGHSANMESSFSTASLSFFET